VPVLFAASLAVMVMTFCPEERGTLQLQGLVPLHEPLPPLSFAQLTLVTPTLSEADPPIPNGVLFAVYVLELVGLVMVTVGGVGSGGV